MPKLPHPRLFLAILLPILCVSLTRADDAQPAKPGPAAPEEWPQWRGPRGDGTWHGPNIPEQWPEGDLRQLWRMDIGGGYSGITVSGGRVYVQDRQREPKEVERVLCLSADDGRVLWTATDDVTYGDLDYGNGPRAAPTVHDGRVYTQGAVGHFNCFDAATGKRLWSTHLVKDHNGRLPMWGYAASPYIVGDTVIILPGAKDDGSVVALSRRTGEREWGSLGDEAGYTAPLLIEGRGRSQLVCWTPSHIRSIDPHSGKPFWSVPYEITYGVAIASPIVHRDIVVICGYWHGSKGIRLGEKNTDHEVIWEENRSLRGLMSQPLARDGIVYLLDKQYGLTAFEIETGTKLWDDKNQLTPRGRNPQASLVWLEGTDRILALNAEGELIHARLTPEGLTELARKPLLGPTWAHPAYAGHRVYARNDTELVCVELPTIPSEQTSE